MSPCLSVFGKVVQIAPSLLPNSTWLMLPCIRPCIQPCFLLLASTKEIKMAFSIMATSRARRRHLWTIRLHPLEASSLSLLHTPQTNLDSPAFSETFLVWDSVWVIDEIWNHYLKWKKKVISQYLLFTGMGERVFARAFYLCLQAFVLKERNFQLNPEVVQKIKRHQCSGFGVRNDVQSSTPQIWDSQGGQGLWCKLYSFSAPKTSQK